MRLRIRPAVTALPLLLLTVGLAGCGSGGEATTAPTTTATETTPALSKRELISQGDGICAEVNAAVGTVSSSSPSANAAGRAGQVAQLYSGMVTRLKGLGTPVEANGYTEFISAAEALAQAEGNARLAAERGESAGLEAAETKASTALASFQSAARAYGFKKCGEEPSAPAPASGGAGAKGEAPAGGGESAAPESAAPEAAPETGGAGSVEAGGGAPSGGGSAGGGGGGGGGGSSSGGIGPG
ncbi:MAG TPA: hypothetical protein VFI63_02350 [Solirubrobacterales bacterium]|nr:hypothetical protein [Solirubrobacterales bacterium]